MVEVHLYGKLRQGRTADGARGERVIKLQPRGDETVRSILERVGVQPEEVCHVFLNGALLTTRNSMGPWLQYLQVSSSLKSPSETGALDPSVRGGDRLGLFARDMALLVV